MVLNGSRVILVVDLNDLKWVLIGSVVVVGDSVVVLVCF